jgi:exopolysaccharide biosynthesis predicted pyruvyltransferase EpsI
VKPDKHPILSFKSKDDYEKLQDLLQSNKTVVTSGLHSLATEDLAEGLTPITVIQQN